MAQRRILLARGSAAVAVAAAVALFVFANAVAARFWTRWDWTATGLYTLSDQTRQVVGGLTRDVRLTSFLVEGSTVGGDVLQQVRSVIDGYRELNPARVHVEWLDPARDPARARSLLSEFDLDPLRDPIDVVVVQSGERRKQVRLSDMVQFDYAAGMAGPPPVRALTVESALTGAILGVTRDRRAVVRFATGHGEREISAGAESGLSRLADALRQQDVELLAWDALGASEVPAGTDVVVIAGPRTAWLPGEREALARYLEQGGRALVLLDPVFQRGAEAPGSTGLEPLLAAWGVAAAADVVIDPARGVPFFGPETLYAPALGLHPVTSALGGQPILFVLARSLTPVEPRPRGVEISVLAESSPDSWGETAPGSPAGVTRDADERGGPLALAVAIGAPRAPLPGDAPGDDTTTDETAAAHDRTAGDTTAGDTAAHDAAAGATAAHDTTAGATAAHDTTPHETATHETAAHTTAAAGGAAAAGAAPVRARLVVVGDSDLAGNGLIDQLMNRSFLLNAVSWLLEEEHALAIPPKERALAKLFLTDDQSRTLLVTLVLLFPAVAIAAGLTVWSRRRRA